MTQPKKQKPLKATPSTTNAPVLFDKCECEPRDSINMLCNGCPNVAKISADLERFKTEWASNKSIYSTERFVSMVNIELDRMNIERKKVLDAQRAVREDYKDGFQSNRNRAITSSAEIIRYLTYLIEPPKSTSTTIDQNLTQPQAALVMIFTGAPGTKEEAAKYAQRHSSGSGYSLYVEVSKMKGALKGNNTYTTPKNLIQNIESILILLDEDAKARANDEIKTIRSRIVDTDW